MAAGPDRGAGGAHGARGVARGPRRGVGVAVRRAPGAPAAAGGGRPGGPRRGDAGQGLGAAPAGPPRGDAHPRARAPAGEGLRGGERRGEGAPAQAAPGRADLDAGAAHRRDGHGQGDRLAPHSPVVRAPRAHLRAHQLLRHSQRADGRRAVRLRARGLLRRHPRLRRPAHRGRGRHRVPRRDRRHPHGAAEQAAARAGGPGHLAPGRERVEEGRLPRGGRQQPRPEAPHRRGEFGADLFERLATVQVVLPPLRERLEDLPALVKQLVDRFYVEDPLAAKRGRVSEITSEALELLGAYAWPGNIRELRNVVFGALVSKRTGESLLVSDLPRRLWARGEESAEEESGLEARLASGSFNLRREVERLERRALELALRRANGNAAEAARLLGEVGRGSAKDPGGTVRVMMKRLKLGRLD